MSAMSATSVMSATDAADAASNMHNDAHAPRRVLGVSMTPSAVRMVLVEGENADGASVDHDTFEIASDGASAISGAPQQVVDAILGTQESAVEGGHRLTSVGIAWTDHADAARLRQRLSRHRLHDVVLVGLQTGGVGIARRLARHLRRLCHLATDFTDRRS